MQDLQFRYHTLTVAYWNTSSEKPTANRTVEGIPPWKHLRQTVILQLSCFHGREDDVLHEISETDGFFWPVNLYFFNSSTIAQNHKGNYIEFPVWRRNVNRDRKKKPTKRNMSRWHWAYMCTHLSERKKLLFCSNLLEVGSLEENMYQGKAGFFLSSVNCV